MTNILINIVDDDDYWTEFISRLLKDNKITDCRVYTNPVEFLAKEKEVHICILDYRFQNSGLDGLDITEELIRRNKRARIIIITLAPSLQQFMKVSNAGAWKYLDKNDPYFGNDILKYVRIGIELCQEEMKFIKDH